ncbi:GspE/PulE family protein [Fundidesulfovibrio agrisoli]|uniref:GspE/PulE family protein n=1 Tax=Fundidesulfovibrio agrisoli TaxID=2922717 RepID=UPI001FAD1A5E|nr:ATPase, T2SS/T4P/T4SS family [Fundidesulfovibrio agrisoli]
MSVLDQALRKALAGLKDKLRVEELKASVLGRFRPRADGSRPGGPEASTEENGDDAQATLPEATHGAPPPAWAAELSARLGVAWPELRIHLAEYFRTGGPLVPLLAGLSKREEAEAARVLAEVLGLEFRSAPAFEPQDVERLRRTPLAYLKNQLVAPAGPVENMLLYTADPLRTELHGDMARMFGAQVVHPVVVPAQALIDALNNVFGQAEEDALPMMDDSSLDDFSAPPPDSLSTADLLDETSNSPVIKLVNLLLTQAVKDLCSDIHLEPYSNTFKIRFRLDGVLYDFKVLDKRWHAPVVSHVKIRSKLDIAEKRLPQDGSFDVRLGNRNVDIRVSVFPTKFGERVVMRLLEKNSRVLSLEELGLSSRHFGIFKDLVTLPHGIILVSGPTGSGKSTTLYAAMNEIKSSDKNILTIEDPVEYQLDGVGQMQVNTKIDLTFASGLRSILRQDPDVILVGEIRDKETAQIACQAALTGHLVFSTLHTNDAAGSVTRLIDFGIESFLVCSTMRAVMAQRLVRKLCTHCREPFIPTPEQLLRLGSSGESLQGREIYRHQGCKNCMNTGFRGRTSIHELLVMNEELAETVMHTSEAGKIRQVAINHGMLTLRQDGIEKVLAGVTTIEEVVKATVV